jgi:glycosyltransferase involved in cell wall biosynthesis
MRRVVITPVYNEQDGIADVLDQMWPQVDILIVVDDGSTDGSRLQVEAWAQERAGVYFVSSPVNRGQSAALKRGYAVAHHLLERGLIADKDPVVEMDSDGQHDPAYLTSLIDFWQRANADIALAQRDFAGYPFYKRVGNWGLTCINSALTGQRYFDAVSNFRVTSARARSELLCYYTGYRYSGSFEANIIYAGLGYKTDNSFKVHVPLYRTGTRAMDGWHIVWTGLRVWQRVRARRPSTDVDAFVRETLADLVLPK